jgi:putative Mg2+ transporter-C (MgtC) family protein
LLPDTSKVFLYNLKKFFLSGLIRLSILLLVLNRLRCVQFCGGLLMFRDIILKELTSGLPDSWQFVHVLIRLIAATFLGAVVGIQREKAGKPAGLRTHMLVTLGTAVFVMACSGIGMSSEALSRVIQGIITGIGFIGAGTILKLSEEQDIRGLTTAAGVWMMAAIGVAVGLGSLGVALLSTFFTLIILSFASHFERRVDEKRAKKVRRETTSSGW